MCLPVLFRLWRGKGTPSPVQLAGELISASAPRSFRTRRIHARRATPPTTARRCWSSAPRSPPGCPANAALYAPAPPRTGKRGRPRLKGHRLGTPAELAATADWRRVTVSRYGHRDTVEIAEIAALWYGAFGTSPVASSWSATPAAKRSWRLFTTDRRNGVERVVARYAHRWPIETAIAAGKQLLGIGQARNRLRRAVERTVPFEFIVYSLVKRCCAGDEGLSALRSRPAGGGFKPPHAAGAATRPW